MQKRANEIIREANPDSVWPTLWERHHGANPALWVGLQRRKGHRQYITLTACVVIIFIVSQIGAYSINAIRDNPLFSPGAYTVTCVVLCINLWYWYKRIRLRPEKKPHEVIAYEEALHELDGAMCSVDTNLSFWKGLGEHWNDDAAREHITRQLMRFARQTSEAHDKEIGRAHV